jgi:integrase
VKRKPHTGPSLARGVTLLYRRNANGPGSWVLKCADGHGGAWTKAIGAADDIQAATGTSILSYRQAVEQALKLARREPGTDAADDGRPITVAEAIDQYESELRANGGAPRNAINLRHHCSATLFAKPVCLLTTTDLIRFRDSMLTRGAQPATFNRIRNNLRACLSLAARRDRRITNRFVWEEDFAALPNATVARNVILPDAEVTKLIACCYNQSRALGLLAETCAQTMCRPSMAARMLVTDLDLTDPAAPRLWVPRSAKGNPTVRAAKREERVPVPITEGLAVLLAEEVKGRAPHDRLLRRANGQPWGHGQNSQYRPAFIEAAKATGLGAEVSIYALRHSGISRALLRGVPTNVVANLADTSEKIMRAHYAREIGQDPRADALARKALLQIEAPAAAGTIVPITRRK